MASISSLETATLSSQVGGHTGILTNESGELVIKPVLPRELAFYQQIRSDKTFSDLLPYVPNFIGTLRLEGEVDYSKSQEEGIAMKPFAEKKDKRFLLLENISHSFFKPNIMDIKLGTTLYDDDAPPEKVARMIETARNTTSLETGIRLTGFQVYDNVTGLAVNTPKSYGKSLKADQLSEGIAKFFPVGKPTTELLGVESSSGLPVSILRRILPCVRDEIKEIRDIFAELELRMVGASLLIVYESDWNRAKEGMDKFDEAEADNEDDDGDEDDDEDEVAAESRPGPPFVVKLIDFAHTKAAPGEGQDKGVITGINTILKLLNTRIGELA